MGMNGMFLKRQSVRIFVNLQLLVMLDMEFHPILLHIHGVKTRLLLVQTMDAVLERPIIFLH